MIDRAKKAFPAIFVIPCLAFAAAATRAAEPGAGAAWVADAVFYQIFPERFSNGDAANDPTRASLEEETPASWRLSPWTGDWYQRDAWERELGGDFFEHGVFHRRYGGDLQGVIDRLDYLRNLGITAIYFNPVFHARSLHKYDGSSFHHIDPHFGPDPAGDLALMEEESADPASWKWTAADRLFLTLLEKAHERGIRVVIDGVFNHTGKDFFAFRDLCRRQAGSPYADWYVVEAFDDPTTAENEFRYEGWWGLATLPLFADAANSPDLHPGPKDYIFAITKRWMDPNGDGNTADGIDGWRLDVASDVPAGFWRDWNAHVRRLNPAAYTVAEEWGEAGEFLENTCFDAVMNYYGFAFPAKGFLIDGKLSASGAVAQLRDRLQAHPRRVQERMLNLIDSHDTDRVASMIVNGGREGYAEAERFDYDTGVSPRGTPDYDLRKPADDERRIQRMVTLLQMTFPGAPMIYYGTEAGMWGADDPCDRMPMVWPDMRFAFQAADPRGRPRQGDRVGFDQSLFDFYRAAIALRQQCPPLRRGSIEFLEPVDEAGFLAFRRSLDGDVLFVGFNRGEKPYSWTLPLPAGRIARQVFTASGDFDQVIVRNAALRATISLPGREGVVIRLVEKE